MPTALITHSVCVQHEISLGHPECPERIDAIVNELKKQEVFDRLVHSEAPAASMEQLLLAHPENYIDLLHAHAPDSGTAQLDADTAMNPYSLQAALRGAGAGILAVDQVMSGEVDNAFCMVRPPGHHAERTQAMGFCFFGNVAIAARHAIKMHGLERVAIVDFDVHHGNGTEDIVDEDPNILFCSSFEYPLYPGGYRENVKNQRVNVPLQTGTGSAEFRSAITETWLPALATFRPQLIIVSAGFDAHAEDPLASLQLQDADFVWITQKILEVAEQHANGRVVSMLEGGYALSALGRCASAHVRGLMSE
ncbi:MAG: acetoin utilization deacetylase AcuC-like enzyme [Granulosicoccus sp.]|jgi:acetoin utilization deacetylase AcuC-like enzyme